MQVWNSNFMKAILRKNGNISFMEAIFSETNRNFFYESNFSTRIIIDLPRIPPKQFFGNSCYIQKQGMQLNRFFRNFALK